MSLRSLNRQTQAFLPSSAYNADMSEFSYVSVKRNYL